MKPLDVVQLVLGIIVGACVLRPDIAGIPPATQEVDWPQEVELTKNENKVEEAPRKTSQLFCRAKYNRNSAVSLPKALAFMPPRAGAFVGRRSSFWGTRGSQISTKNLDISKEEEKENSKEEVAVMIATHHGCEVF